MGRALLAGLALAIVLPLAACAQPTDADIARYRVRLAEFVARTDDPNTIVKWLNDWYGWVFIARRDHSNDTVDYLVKAPVLGNEIRYLRTIGSVSKTAPRVLVETEEELAARQRD